MSLRKSRRARFRNETGRKAGLIWNWEFPLREASFQLLTLNFLTKLKKTKMKKLNFTLAILILSGLIFYGFTFERSKDYKLSFTVNSPLDLSGLIKKTEVKKDADNPESSDWYSEAVSNIQKAEYNVSFSEDLNAFQSPNRANNMRFV